jgi:hypothetical protein
MEEGLAEQPLPRLPLRMLCRGVDVGDSVVRGDDPQASSCKFRGASKGGAVTQVIRMEVAVAGPQAENGKAAGLECPVCGCRHFYCLQTRQRPKYVYRQKQCRHCKKVVTTTERIIGG